MGCESSKAVPVSAPAVPIPAATPAEAPAPVPAPSEPAPDVAATPAGNSGAVGESVLVGTLEAKRKERTVDKARARKGLIGRKETFVVRLDPDEDAELGDAVDAQLGAAGVGAEGAEAGLVGAVEAAHAPKEGGDKKPVDKARARKGLVGRKETFVVRLDPEDENAELADRVDAQLGGDDVNGGGGGDESAAQGKPAGWGLIGRHQTFLVRVDPEELEDAEARGGADDVPQRKMWIKQGSSFLSRMDTTHEQAILRDLGDAGLIQDGEKFVVCTRAADT